MRKFFEKHIVLHFVILSAVFIYLTIGRLFWVLLSVRLYAAGSSLFKYALYGSVIECTLCMFLVMFFRDNDPIAWSNLFKKHPTWEAKD